MKGAVQKLVKVVMWVRRLVGLGGRLEIDADTSVSRSLCVGELGCSPRFNYEGVWSKRFVGVEGWDAVYSTFDPYDNVRHEVIGTYHGWDPRAVYIAGYNAFNAREGRRELSATERVHIGKERVTIHLDSGRIETFGDVIVKDSQGRWRAAMHPNGGVDVGFDFRMARTTDGDFNWKRALVPFPTKLEINFAGDFRDGVRITGPVEIVHQLVDVNGPGYTPAGFTGRKVNPDDIRSDMIYIDPLGSDYIVLGSGGVRCCILVYGSESRIPMDIAIYHIVDGRTSDYMLVNGIVCLDYVARDRVELHFENNDDTQGRFVYYTCYEMRIS